MIQAKVETIAAKMIEVYPLKLEVTAVVEEDAVTFIGKAYDIEGPYDVVGSVTMDEIVSVGDEDTLTALVLLRAMIQ